MQKEHHPPGGVLFAREATVLPGSGFHRSIELGGGASEGSAAQKERHPHGCLSFWWTRRGSFFRRKATSRALLCRSPQVRRHKRFAQQNLGAGGIHFRRASQIALGAERPTGAQPKNKATPEGGFVFGGLEGDRTLDLTDANRTLSQLSYEPIFEQGGDPAQIIIYILRENATLFLRPYSITGSFATTAAQRGHSSGNCSLAPTRAWCFQQRRHFWPLASVTMTRTPAMGVSLPSA